MEQLQPTSQDDEELPVASALAYQTAENETQFNQLIRRAVREFQEKGSGLKH
jgi:hypothetical protein